MICSSMLTVFLEFRSRKLCIFEQIMSADIFSHSCTAFFCCTQSSGWVLLILWYKANDLLWSSVIAWSDRRGPNSLGITIHHCEATLHRRTRTKCSVFKIRKDQLTCWLVKNEFWGQKHGYETDDLKGNFQLEVFDWESKSSSLSWSSWIHISFFQQLLFESISSVVWQIVSISGESSKLKVRDSF